MTAIKKIASGALLFALLMVGAASQAVAATPQFDVSGNWNITFDYLGSPYTHDMTLTQAPAGDLTGSGGYPAGGPQVYAWTLISGAVSGSAINFSANYTASADAVTPQTTMVVDGVIAANGTMSGTWSDNYAGGVRTGTWTSTSGGASPILLGALAAEDFGVMDQSGVKGYTAGFGLTDATFAGAQSVVIKLYSGATLLQTNNATALVGTTILGNQISSPFDVFGTFDYVTDGYWTNVREAEYGQTLIPTKVVATVTLANGKVLTAENNLLTGDPATIFPVVVPPTITPTDKNQCKNNGWKTFTSPSFKNQGQCVSYTNHN